VPGEYANWRARPDGGLCAPADHGAGAKATVIHAAFVFSEGSAEEGWEGGSDVHVEAVGGSKKLTRFRREGEGDAP
jgi:hypothetical protein